jgi:hypothetical protein
MTVTLNEAEQRLARYLGRARHDTNTAAGVPLTRCDRTRSGEEIHIEGVGAEIAFCKLFNVYPDFSVTPRVGGSDAVWGGRTVDVKTTSHPSGRLLARPNKRDDPSDLYVLMVGTFPTYRCAGFVTPAALFMAERLTNPGHGACYAINQRDLLQP